MKYPNSNSNSKSNSKANPHSKPNLDTNSNPNPLSNPNPRFVYEAIRELCQDKILVVRGDDPLSREAQHNSTLLFQILIRSKLATKRVLKEHRLNEEALKWLIGSIAADFHAAVVHPGEMCGVRKINCFYYYSNCFKFFLGSSSPPSKRNSNRDPPSNIL
jgi:hypothetical protein